MGIIRSYHTTMTEAHSVNRMIERVARAIWEDRHPDKPWLNQEAQVRMDFCGHAVAAIVAMREPTGRMTAAGQESMPAAKGYILPDDCMRVWRAMIDAALRTPDPEQKDSRPY
jgi:hypothetical protein